MRPPRPDPDDHGEPAGEWWGGYFGRDFLQLYEPLLPPEEAGHEVDAAVEALELRPPAPVLDLACGWGRHSIELARRGYRVTGLDLSEALLEEARRRASERDVIVEWVREDMRDLHFEGRFAAVLCFFSSLGYSLSDEDDLRILQGVRRALAPGGHLLLETVHRDLVAREFAERDWWEGPDGQPVWVERDFDAVQGVSREWLRWGTLEKYHEIRIRSATEWAALLERAGFDVDDWLGGWDLEPFSHASERLIVVASSR